MAILLVVFFLPLLCAAQKTPLRVQVRVARNEPLPFASILLHNRADTSLKYASLADSTGQAIFPDIAEGPWFLTISAVGYKDLRQAIMITDTTDLLQYEMRPSSETLGNVVVTAARPIMRQEDDKTIVDPENLAASSTNSFEILEKTPGLFVDQDGNIYLSSTTPATIYINGREQKMSTADIATLLKSLPPGAVSRIEIMRTPSARYDASGSGGIVNVVLKKGVKIGLTGSVNGGMNQGRYGNQFLGANLNNNNGKLTTYLNTQVSRRYGYEVINTNRYFTPDSLLQQSARSYYPAEGVFLGLGITYALTPKWELSYDGRINYNRAHHFSRNASTISEAASGNIATSNEARVENEGRNANIGQSLSAKLRIDSSGSEWSTDLSFTYGPNNIDQSLQTNFIIPRMAPRTILGNIDNRLLFYSAQSNLLLKLPRRISVETGLKTTVVQFRNRTEYSVLSSYRYRENINALYLQASKDIRGIILKVGTRFENTNNNGRQTAPGDTSFPFRNNSFFPYVYLSRNIMKIAGYDLRAYLVYRKTINRPAYEYLNPYPRLVDPYLQESGNPSLRPQFTRNYEANISVDERPVVAVGINETKDIFTQVVYQSDTANKTLAFRTYDNLGKNKEFYFRALGAIPPGKRYFFVLGTQYNHNFYQGLYEGAPLQFRRGSWSVFTYQTFKINPLLQATLNGFARFKGQLQFYELSPFGALNFSLTQQFFKKRLVATLSAQDIFFTNNNEFVLKQGSVNASGMRQGDTRRFGLNLRYTIGFRKKEENNIFQMESPEKTMSTPR